MLQSSSSSNSTVRPLPIGPQGAYIVRILMIGDSNVGKTSLVLRYDTSIFSSRFVTTIGVDYRDKQITLGSTSIRLQLWDTAGQERFRSLTSNFFGRADGFVLTYSINSRSSFEHCVGWLRDIQSRAPPDVEIILVGNKCDLEDEERAVSYDSGFQLAREYGIEFFEASAKTGSNVEDAFLKLSTLIKNSRIPNDGYEDDNHKLMKSSSNSFNKRVNNSRGNSNSSSNQNTYHNYVDTRNDSIRLGERPRSENERNGKVISSLDRLDACCS